MNKTIVLLIIASLAIGCKKHGEVSKRIPVAEVGNEILYYDEIPAITKTATSKSDSTALIQSYINKWAKRKLLLQKAEANLTTELKNEIAGQLEESRSNLYIYQYQKQLMLSKMDTIISDSELENYYAGNQSSFILTSNIVKALFIKIPLNVRDLIKIKSLARSNDQRDLKQLKTLCYKNAEKFDDFSEEWVPMNRIAVQLQDEIGNEENFLKRNTYYESSDSYSLYIVSIRDFRLRSSLAPFEYVKDDIKRIIWNTRRFDFIQSLENGIYNEALKANNFKIY